MLPYGAAGSTCCAAELLNTAPHVMWMRSYGLILKEGEIFHIVCSFSIPQEHSYFLILHWCSAHSQTALLGTQNNTLSLQWCVFCILNTLLRESDRFYAQPKLSRHLPGLRVMLMSLGETCVLLMVALTSTLTSDCSMNSSAQPLLSRLTGKSQR